MRRAASHPVTLREWPGMEATSEQVAQLAMLRLLYLQVQVRRAVRLRQREAAVMLARASVETLILGLYCMRVPEAVAELHACNIKALIDSLIFVADTGLAPESVIRDCARSLGEPSRDYMKVRAMVAAIDAANGNTAARSVYRCLYAPLSNFTVHASGVALLRHVCRDGRLRHRPSRTWNRRSPARVADAAAGFLAADLAGRSGKQSKQLVAYANKHMDRGLVPMFVMAFTGIGTSESPFSVSRIIDTARLTRETYSYLWHGPGATAPLEDRVAYVRERFSAILPTADLDLPPGAFDPLIDHVAESFARVSPEPTS